MQYLEPPGARLAPRVDVAISVDGAVDILDECRPQGLPEAVCEDLGVNGKFTNGHFHFPYFMASAEWTGLRCCYPSIRWSRLFSRRMSIGPLR